MLSHYDEDLSQNKFFIEIKQNHEDILKTSAEQDWIICVPRSGSLINENNLINTILDHILVKDSANNYNTLSKKKVSLEDHYLNFEQNTIFSSAVEVLFEETHYIEDIQKYTVWCIERPLFLPEKHCDVPSNITLDTIQDCVDFLYFESFGHSILKNIQKLCLEFWNTHKDNFETENLQCQKDLIGNLYSQCLQVFYKSTGLQEKSGKQLQFFENCKISIEAYMQYCLGKSLIFSVNTVQHLNDYALNRIIRNSLDVSLKDLNVSEEFSDLILNAKYELCRINKFVTVLDKLNCLSRTFHIFNKHSFSEPVYVTSDDFLQILVYLVLKSNIPNWAANLTFLKEFNFATIEHADQNSFLITSLEAAIEFINSSQFLVINNNKSVLSDEQTESSLFFNLYNKLKSDRKKLVFNNYFKENISQFCKGIELCHPLCSCQNCEPHLLQTSDQKSYKILNKFSQNFIMLACIQNDVNLLEFLFSLDFDLNFKDCFGKTALHYAAEKGYQDILLLLVNSNANVNVLDNDHNTPLHLACDRGHDNCVKALIYSSAFVEINLQNVSGETPLFLATRWGYYDIIKILLETGASVCVKNNQNLSVYKLSPNYYITKLFKQFGNERSNNILEEATKDTCLGSTHIVPSISRDNCKKVSEIFKEQGLLYGIKPKNDFELKQLELLLKTIESNDLPLSYFYLGYNTSVETENVGKKCHPLCTCTQCLKIEDCYGFEQNKSKSHKFNVNLCNNDGFTALHIAAKFGRTEIVRILLDSGAFLNVQTFHSRYTPLHLAVMFQRVHTVKELLKCGSCNVDAKDSKGNTPLYYACVGNNLKIVEILLYNCADCQKRDNEKSILQECEEKSLFRVCRMLRESMGYFTPKNENYLSEASSNNDFGDNTSEFEFL